MLPEQHVTKNRSQMACYTHVVVFKIVAHRGWSPQTSSVTRNVFLHLNISLLNNQTLNKHDFLFRKKMLSIQCMTLVSFFSLKFAFFHF